MTPGTFAERLAISVVVCAHGADRRPGLLEAVQSIRAQTVPAHEVIVVVNRNASLREDLATALTDATVVANTHSADLAGARNTGVARAGGSVVAFLDNDAVAAPDWLEYLARGYSHPGVVAVAGSVEPVWEPSRPALLPARAQLGRPLHVRGASRTAHPVRDLMGANMSFRRDVFVEVGGFDSGLGRAEKHLAGGEEAALSMRLLSRRAGRVLVYEPRAVVRHRVSVERDLAVEVAPEPLSGPRKAFGRRRARA
jgi:glucosyl-dolichyl phosphate glucuronosyltransferase